MPWIVIRSKRAPAFWAPPVLAVLLILALFLGIERWMDGDVHQLQTLAETDPTAAAAGAQRILKTLCWIVGGFCLLVAALFARQCQLGLRQRRMPPLGWWSLGASRAAVGTTATRLARIGMIFAILLGLFGVAFVILGERVIGSFAGRIVA